MSNPTIDDLRESFESRIQGDTTFRTLTGATAGDPRLYFRFEGTAKVSPSQPVYAVYALLSSGESTNGLMQPVFQVTLWAHDTGYASLRDLKNRLKALLDRQTWAVGSDRVQARLVREVDTDDPPNGFIGRVTQFRVACLDRVS